MSTPTPEEVENNVEVSESFADAFQEYEQSHRREPSEGPRQIEATVIALNAESAFLDIGFKTEGILPLTAFKGEVTPGDKFLVSMKGRDEDGYYMLSLLKVAQPKDWTSLQEAFEGKTAISGTVTAMVKGGFSVDVGVRAFMPSSRSGVRDAAEMEKLVGQEIRCRITKLDEADEDVVVDRRGVLEEEGNADKERRLGEIKEGDTVHGTVRSLASYGAFIDIGGVDGLLHVGEICWERIANPADVLSVGQEIDAKVLKIEPETKRISLSMKQLLAHPWDAVAGKYVVGERVRGTVSRAADFGAFVQLEPGVEGLIHVSEMSWAKKVRKASDMLKEGDTVEAVILGIQIPERRMSLGLKQALGDPWVETAEKITVGSVVEGPVSSFTKFGAFVTVAEGVEGLIHISELSAENRINHPSEVLRVGQTVKAQVLQVDREKRQLRLSIKQLVPTGMDEFLAEHSVGEVVSGRIIDVSGERARVELGEGIVATAKLAAEAVVEESKASGAVDLSAFSSMLKDKWKTGGSSASKPEAAKSGQVRSFKISKLDADSKTIELEAV